MNPIHKGLSNNSAQGSIKNSGSEKTSGKDTYPANLRQLNALAEKAIKDSAQIVALIEKRDAAQEAVKKIQADRAQINKNLNENDKQRAALEARIAKAKAAQEKKKAAAANK